LSKSENIAKGLGIAKLDGRGPFMKTWNSHKNGDPVISAYHRINDDKREVLKSAVNSSFRFRIDRLLGFTDEGIFVYPDENGSLLGLYGDNRVQSGILLH